MADGDRARAKITAMWPVADGLGQVEVALDCDWSDFEEAADLVSKVVAKYEFAEAFANHGIKPKAVAA